MTHTPEPPVDPIEQPSLFECDMDRGAEFSPCRTWRYVLWRMWDPELPSLMFVGLNPSVADEQQDDRTIVRCIGFAKTLGYGGLLMLNAYGFTATKPKNLWLGRHDDASPVVTNDPIGPRNDQALASWQAGAGLIIAAWGAHCSDERERAVCNAIGQTIHCLGRTKFGKPKHPLYLRADTKPEVYWYPGIERDANRE